MSKLQPYQALIGGLAGVGALSGLAATGVTTGATVVPLIAAIVAGLMTGHLVQNTTTKPPTA